MQLLICRHLAELFMGSRGPRNESNGKKLGAVVLPVFRSELLK